MRSKYDSQVTARKRKILVVDDDPAMRVSLSVLLENWGFEALQASDAVEATEIAQRQSPDLWRFEPQADLLLNMQYDPFFYI